MKNRFFLAIAAIMVTGALLLSVTAQSNITVSSQVARVGTTVYLQPDVSGLTGDFFTFYAINNTKQTIPAGTKIYWQLTSTVKGSKVLAAPLPAGAKIFCDNGPNPASAKNPQAWYLK